MKKTKKVLISGYYSKKTEQVIAKFAPMKNSQRYIGYYKISARRLKQLEKSLCYTGGYLVLPEWFHWEEDGSAVEFVCPDEDDTVIAKFNDKNYIFKPGSITPCPDEDG